MPDIQINQNLLDEKLTALEEASSWSPRVISRLEMMMLSGDDDDVFRINPVQFAAEKGISENEAIDLFLHSTKPGLFEMEWHLVCAYCGNLMSSFKTLATLHSHFICNFCSVENDLSLDNYIQVSFTIAPRVREIIFHHPEKLSIEDYYFKYHLSKGVAFQEGMPDFLDVYENQIVKALAYIDPGEKKNIEIEVGPGALLIIDMNTDAGAFFVVEENLKDEQEVIPVNLSDGQFHFPSKPLGSKGFEPRRRVV